MRICVITDIPSPYQIELFNCIARREKDFSVIYVRRNDPSRQWAKEELGHDHVFLEDIDPLDEERYVNVPELIVFSHYRHPRLPSWMKRRSLSGKPWCFWGERLGFSNRGFAGYLYRRWKLARLHQSHAPIWGIGNWAIDSYQKEFGNRRRYFNVPYFSDLERFRSGRDRVAASDKRVILYSGSLSERKGVDLLAEAFLRIAPEFPYLHLDLMGDGPMREQLEQQLQPVRDRVRFLGFKDWSELPKIYAEADLLCVPSCHDGWALVVPEGLAAGLPVIGTDRTGAALELISDWDNGWLVSAGSTESLATAMRSAATIPWEHLSQMAETARETAVHHSLSSGADRFLRAAEDTIGCWKS
jgi:glycosyltransferase involved in cell wall biosynthesis